MQPQSPLSDQPFSGQPAYSQPAYSQPMYSQAANQPAVSYPPTPAYADQHQYQIAPPSGYPAPNYPQYAYPVNNYPQAGYQRPPEIDKHVGWFVINWLFFWPLAIYSLVSHFTKIDESAVRGDLAGAQEHAREVAKLGKLALLIGLLLWGFLFFIPFILLGAIWW